MRKLTWFQSAWIIGAMLSVAITPATVDAGQTTTTGYVVDAADESPIRGARLQVAPSGSSSHGPLASTTTRDDGGFEMPAVDANGVLSVGAPGYATKRLRWPNVGSGDPLEIKLDRAARLILHVKDQAGAFVPAMLSIATHHTGNYIVSGARSQSGIVDVTGLASGPTIIVAKAEGFAPATLSLDVAPGLRYGPIELTLQRAGSVAGVVVDGAGNPVRDAVVTADYDAETPMKRTLANYIGGRVRTGEDGSFLLTNIVPKAVVTLSATRNTSASTTTSVGPGERRTDLVIVLR